MKKSLVTLVLALAVMASAPAALSAAAPQNLTKEELKLVKKNAEKEAAQLLKAELEPIKKNLDHKKKEAIDKIKAQANKEIKKVEDEYNKEYKKAKDEATRKAKAYVEAKMKKAETKTSILQ